jgi:hypothetical protein
MLWSFQFFLIQEFIELNPALELENVWVVFTVTFWPWSMADKQPWMDLLETSSPTEYFNIGLMVLKKTGGAATFDWTVS